MKIAGCVLGWLFSAFFALLLGSMLLLQNWLPALLMLLALFLVLPPLWAALRRDGRPRLPLPVRLLVLVGLWLLFLALILGGRRESIYLSPEAETRLLEIYDEKMEGWPLPHEDLFIRTRYGRVHVIASGPADAPPLMLLHASGVGGWSWKYNAGELGGRYRLYAPDLIGDAGKSRFDSLDEVMENGEDQAALYAEIMDSLGVARAPVIGASEGGFIASNLALRHPGRVEKLVLLGPMGYAGATGAIVRITLAQLFPLGFVQDATFRWAFSDSEALMDEFGEWFRLLMSGTSPVKVAPFPLSAEQRRSLEPPVLFVFGTRDRLVGDPAAARELVSDVPGHRVEVLEAGHLMAAELPDEADALILRFLDENRSRR